MRMERILMVEEKHPDRASNQDAAARPESALVRRLVQARDDPVKERVLGWLADIDDARLQEVGFTRRDIAILREAKSS